MEINNTTGPSPHRGPDADPPIDITRPNRKAIRKGVEEFEARRAEAARVEHEEASRRAAHPEPKKQADTVDLSAEGKLLAHHASSDAGQKAHVAELRELHLAGRLNTPERIDRAASKMLGGS